MTRVGGVLRRGAVAVVVPLLTVACSPAASPSRPTPATPPSSAAASPERDPTASEPPDEAPAPGSMNTPATSVGELSLASFPNPARLRPGWAYTVDMGDAEEGYVGNGTPALARDPGELAQTVVPFGCPRPHPLPVPRRALEVDYTWRGVKVIAIRAGFDGPAEAAEFLRARTRNLRACAGRTGGPAVGPLVHPGPVADGGLVRNGRTQESDPWVEVAFRDRDTVVLLAAPVRWQQPPLTAADARYLQGEFRR